MTRRPLLAAFSVLVALANAHAAEQTVRGNVFVVKNPGTPDQRKISMTAKEPFSDDTLVGNPVANGATVTVTAKGATPTEETYALPAGTSASGKPFWSGDALKGFRYSDPAGQNGPVKKAQIKLRNGKFQITVTVDGRLAPVGVVPPAPGSSGCVHFVIVAGDGYSVQFASGQVTNKGTAQFKVSNPLIEGSCLPTTTTTSSSTTTSTTSSTTTTLSIPFITPPGPAPLRYRDLVFSGVSTTSNVVYGSAVNNSGQTVTLMLDIYQPTGDAVTARPAIVWVHGGSFCCGDKTSGEIVDEANTFARKGYFNVSINYRLEPPGCVSGSTVCIVAIQEALADAQTAVRFLRTNKAVYGIDGSRIAIGGSSAGAITAVHVGFSSSEDPSAAVAGAVSLSGANFMATADAGDAPLMMFHGTSDPLVPYGLATATLSQALAVGLDAFLTTWQGAGHVPYVQHRTEILDQTTNFLYWEMDLANAAQ